jgi:hypothetical protein
MRITKDWTTTFELLDEYPIGPTMAPAPAEKAVEEEKKAPEPVPEKRKKFRIREGSMRDQIREAVEAFPGSTSSDITHLIGREKDAQSAVAASCKAMVDSKVLVRSKNDKGCYIYRSPASVVHH